MKLSLTKIDIDHLPAPLRKIYFIFYTLSRDASRCDLFKFASAMAYVTLLSLVPSVAAIFAIVSVFSPVLGENSQFIDQIKEVVIENLAAGSGEVAVQYIEDFIANLNIAKIGATGFAGISLSLILLLRNIEGALNRIFLVAKARNVFLRFVYFWTFVTLGTVLTGVSLGFLSNFDMSNLNPFASQAADKGFWGFLFPKFAAFLFFATLYTLVPNTAVRIKDAAFGAFFASILFSIASRFYTVFTSQFTNYEAVYGALASIPIFLLWLYIVWLIILVGGLLAWRWSQGFEAVTNEKEGERIGQMEEFGALGLHEVTLYGMLSLITAEFHSMKGEGIGLFELARQLKVPQNWLVTGSALLQEVGLITSKSTENGDEIYFPAIPIGSLTLKEIRDRIRQPVNSVFDLWMKDATPQVESACRSIWENRANAHDSERWSKIIGL